MQVIKHWLTGNRNFHVGKAIYAIVGDNPSIKSLLDQGETPFAVDKLTDYLVHFSIEKLTNAQAPAPVDSMPDSDNSILIAIKNEWLPLYQKINYLRHSLDAPALKGEEKAKAFVDENSDEAINYRFPIAKEILDLEKRVMLIWDKREHYLQHGSLPFEQDKKQEIPTDPLELAALITSIKKNIRYNRKKLADNPAAAKYASLLEHYRQLHIDVTGKKYEEK